MPGRREAGRTSALGEQPAEPMYGALRSLLGGAAERNVATDIKAAANKGTFKELVTPARIQRWKELRETKCRATELELRSSRCQTVQRRQSSGRRKARTESGARGWILCTAAFLLLDSNTLAKATHRRKGSSGLTAGGLGRLGLSH